MAQSNNKFISILICCYNGEKFLNNCLSSLDSQTIKQFQTVIVDDGSIDKSLKIIENYANKHPNTLILHHPKNRGLPLACNTGLAHMKTPYFARLDIDDYLLPNFISTAKRTVENNYADFFISDRYEIKNNKKKRITNISKDIYYWIACGTIFKKDSVLKVGKYTDEYWEEYDLYIRLLEKGYRFHYIKKPLYVYYKHKTNMTAVFEKRKDGLDSLKRKWREEILIKYGNYKKHLLGDIS